MYEDTSKLYVHIPNSGRNEHKVSSTTNYNIIDTSIQAPESHISEPSQQIGDTPLNADTEILYVHIPTSITHENIAPSTNNNSIPNTSIQDPELQVVESSQQVEGSLLGSFNNVLSYFMRNNRRTSQLQEQVPSSIINNITPSSVANNRLEHTRGLQSRRNPEDFRVESTSDNGMHNYFSEIYTTIKQTRIQHLINNSRILIQHTNTSLRNSSEETVNRNARDDEGIHENINRVETITEERKRLHRLRNIKKEEQNRCNGSPFHRFVNCLCYISIFLLFICACCVYYQAPMLLCLIFAIFCFTACCTASLYMLCYICINMFIHNEF